MMVSMSKLQVLAGGIVEPGVGRVGAVSAYVAFSGGLGKSRLFKVQGRTDTPRVVELDAATTVDLGRFRQEVVNDLQPEVVYITSHGGTAAITEPRPQWVAGVVSRHLRALESQDGK
jgi:hypothetical protein